MFTLANWLTRIAKIHPHEIELGLARVKAVAQRLGVEASRCPVIVVGGTNGKGSTLGGLEKIYRACGYRVGAFTSPMLYKFNEQIRIDGIDASDDQICTAFEKIEQARGDILLTAFEFQTLAALYIFNAARLEVMLLEVGLGGRLDAVNIIDADLAIVTSVSLDHMDYLGHTREAIGFEKAGIFRPRQDAVCGDANPPQRLLEYAARLGTHLYCQQRDFKYRVSKDGWSWSFAELHYDNLPIPKLAIENMSCVLMAASLMQKKLPINKKKVAEAIADVRLPGRIEIIPGEVTRIVDVAHNPASISLLAMKLNELPCLGKTHAVFSMLEDKDIAGSLSVIAEHIDVWHVAPLQCKRAARVEKLKQAFLFAKISAINWHVSVAAAYKEAMLAANPGDRVIIFGSFHTVADVIKNSA